MNSKQKQISFLIFLIILIFIINYPFLDGALKEFLTDYNSGFVERVIDGDTIVINDTSVRLLGINTPEKKEPYYSEAKDFLEELVLNKPVRLEYGKDKYDRYKRILAYIHLNNQNLNLELVKQGLANFYFPAGKDIHYEKFKKAWEDCIEENKNLCTKSENKCANCIEIKKLDYKTQDAVFYNKCNFDCDMTGWKIKDEGRKSFVFPEFVLEKNKEITIKVDEGQDNARTLFWEHKTYVWTKTGDTLFLRDPEGGLVLWESY